MKPLGMIQRSLGRLDTLWLIVALQVIAIPAHAALEKEFVWESFGEKETLKVKIPQQLQTHYSSKTRTYRYGNYLLEDTGYELNARLADAFTQKAAEEHLGEWALVNLVVDFVQSLEYQPETGEYPKYPVETLMDGGGDCEDTSILLAAILDNLGLDCILLSPPGHMAVGVAVSGLTAKHYPYNGHNYYYVETTGVNWNVGAIPPAYAGTAKIYGLPTAINQARRSVSATAELDLAPVPSGELTNIMVAFYRAAIGDDPKTKQPLYRYQVHLEADDDVLAGVTEVQYRFTCGNGEIDPAIPWMRAYDVADRFEQEWTATAYRPMQVRIIFANGNLVQTFVQFGPGSKTD
jgi:transglutaminase-like putative cysteine protease